MVDRYYEEELRYLTEAAKEFARAHPEEARLLDIESLTDRDPYVERLFEGFAFLAGRIREKLDDEFPELARSLFETLWPHYLRPIPSLAILEFRPRAGLLQKSQKVPAGTPVLSNPIGRDRLRCRFKTCYPVTLHPIYLRQVLPDRTPSGKPAIRMKFSIESGVEPSQLELSELRFFLHADPAAAFQLHLSLTHQLESVLVLPSGTRLGGKESIRPAGFSDEEGILPTGRSTHPAYRLLQEYFAFREKFLFVTLSGLEKLELAKGTQEFELQLILEKALPEGLRFSEDNFRLYCAPVINLFDHDAEPLRVDHSRLAYRVIPSVKSLEGFEIYSIETISGIEFGTGRLHNYRSFHEFQFEGDSPSSGKRSFDWSSDFGPSERWETMLSLHGVPLNTDQPQPENLSIGTKATNGKLPRDLGEGDISTPTDESPSMATFANLTKPTLPLYPPRREFFLWRLLSHMVHSHLSLSDSRAVRQVLELYDWSQQEANRRRIEGIRDIKVTPRDWLLRGAVVRGVAIAVELDEGHFAGRGDAHIFGLVLREFFRRYVTLNSVVELTILLLPSLETYHWPPQEGTQALL